MNKDQSSGLKTSSLDQSPAGLAREGNKLLAFVTATRKKRLWITEPFQPEHGTNVLIAMKIRGQLDAQIVEESVRQVLSRYPHLSALFAGEGKDSSDSFPARLFRLIDLSTEAEPQQKLRVLCESETSPADETAAASLIRMNAQEHWLVINSRASNTLPANDLLKEIEESYEGLSKQGAPRELAYSWQGEWSVREEDHLSYWKKQLELIPDMLELPTDQPPSGRPRAMHVFSLEPDVSVGLLRFSQGENATLFMTVLAALQTLLYRYTSQKDLVVVISPLWEESGVHRHGLAQMPLLMKVFPDATYKQHLAQVRELVLEAGRHRFCSNEDMAKLIASKPVGDRLALSQICLIEEPIPDQEAVQTQGCLSGQEKPGFDLKLSFQMINDIFHGCMEYNPTLFEPATVKAMVDCYQVLLQQISAGCEEKLSALHLARDISISARWSGEAKLFGPQRTICEMLSARASRSPEALALFVDQKSLSYGDLHRHASQMARFLQENSIKVGDRIGVRLKPSIHLMIAVLGVLQAGAVVVWLDPLEPEARLRFMVEDSGLRFVVTEEQYAMPLTGVRTIYIDKSKDEIEQESQLPVPVDLKEDDLACILYRSSPQGRPEGVLISHRALWAGGWGREWNACTDERVGLSVDFNHDMTCFEVFRILASGACIVHVDQSLPPRKLAGLLREQQVTVWWTSASVLERLASDFPRALKSVRLLLCDDQMNVLYRLHAVLKPDIQEKTFGIYGWTEAGGNCLRYPVAEMGKGPGRIDPACHMVAGAEFYILDENQQPVPEGVLGQIYIGSDALALGYHGQPTHTASVFYVHSDSPRRRLFCTGDWARYRTDGTLEYRGRRDGRRVIGGLRVEVEEVENLLRQYPAVLDAAVLPHDLPGLRDAGLAGLVATSEGQIISIEAIHEFLKGQLPSFMLPLAVVRVDAIPHKQTGELDRRALNRLMENSQANAASSNYVAPRTPVESEMAAIWAQALGLQRIGIHDNFFRIGGHSLLAAQTIARMSEAFGVDIPMTKLFGAPSIAEMAKVVKDLVQGSRKTLTASS
ncbi:MAG TPA: AMP-binding protein [Candidatus Angelobacter sp.]|nr:AMP-binding protein [Candidatus Angelobacter sp.]